MLVYMLRCLKADFEEVDFFVWKPYNKSSVVQLCNQVQVDLLTTSFYNHMPAWIPIIVKK